MKSANPPPIPNSTNVRVSRVGKALVILAIVVGFFGGVLPLLRALGLVRPFRVPTGGMAPAISPGDHIFMEGVSYLFRQPRRGEIVIFKTDGIESLPDGTFYEMRVAGLPSERVELSAGKLLINGKEMSLSNALGPIEYAAPSYAQSLLKYTNLTLPANGYFVLGDNSTNSFDSRYWGSVPRKNIVGRVYLRYWPPERIGSVK